jgi:hypothetical protein
MTERGTRTRAEWGNTRRRYLEKLAATQNIELVLRDRVWAVTPDGRWVALPGVTATSNPDLWWLGYRRDEFRRREAVGAILLCASVDRPLLDFGLPTAFIGEIEHDLSVGNEREQLYFNVLHRSGRFELQLRGGRSVDITRRLGEMSWLRRPGDATGRNAVGEAKVPYERASQDRGQDRGAEARFFARWVDAALRPLDPIDLRDGAVYLLQAHLTDGVPRSAALRRIAARGGPSDLPRDLAEQHDHYAHGRPRR